MEDTSPEMLSIFAAAIERPSPEERAAFLDGACGSNAELRRRIDALMEAHDAAGGFLQDSPAAGDAGPTMDRPIDERPGGQIGMYKLLEQIGEGGMGTVWTAQQTEPVKRVVALKLIKAGMDSRQVIARFEAERQALALMDHVNIARVIDAGTTSAGRPYFVMDLVKGVPINSYCDEHHLTPRKRLELFIPVCQAVQHAHQKGIIHRDLKPSNVLVALYDGKPVPKVIDFGVAKATGQSLTDKTLITGFGAIVGTLEYMSPEQAEINQLDIDTRSDIYSLGVLLYELLAGSPPFSRKDLAPAGLLEMLRFIREKEPSKPSTKLSSAEGLPTLAANRGTEPAKLTKLMRDELDWIVMKALEKDRNRRYETANSFALDVQQYLNDERVQACPPTAWYRFRKFARRNKAAIATAATVGLALLLTVVVMAVSNALIARQRDEARVQHRLARQAVDDMYTQVAEKWLHDKPGLGPLEQEFLEKALAYYEQFAKEESDDPAIQHETALAYSRVAWICTELRQFDKAESALRHALTVFGELAKRFPKQVQHRYELARATWNQGFLLQLRGRLEEAEPFYREADSDLQKLASGFLTWRPTPRNWVLYTSTLGTSLIAWGGLRNGCGTRSAALPFIGSWSFDSLSSLRACL
jgi:serine/threonine protein kinase